MRWPGALKGTSSVRVLPHSLHAHLGRKTSILALSILLRAFLVLDSGVEELHLVYLYVPKGPPGSYSR